MSPDQLISTLNFRYAACQFDPARKIGDTAWTALEQSLHLSPSSFGLQPWRFSTRDIPRSASLAAIRERAERVYSSNFEASAKAGVLDRLHLWPDHAALATKAVRARQTDPCAYLKWLNSYWYRISEWLGKVP